MTSSNLLSTGRIFALVTLGALGGLAMGAAFGFGAGKLTPTFFAHFIPWNDVEPVGFAVVLGAVGGPFLGGGLALFSLLLHLILKLGSRGKVPTEPIPRA
jgi:hypothetical protein